ncbi:MAG: PA2778 family cysteine peptidase [Ectothiorhodospiraceae bacterium]|nr:PA2778 family cysteine peptidase [Ectothiorhodospiraceae bacterium]
MSDRRLIHHRFCHHFRYFLFYSLLLVLSGCASGLQTQQLRVNPAGFPDQKELSHTPFFPQQQYQCGPAALATVLNHSGVKIDAQSLQSEIYLPSRRGSLQIEILASTRRHNRVPYKIEPTLFALFSEITAGNPVLVLQNLGFNWAPQWHYAVVIGFNIPQRTVILRSGMEARHMTAMDTFELTWARSNYWGLVITAPDNLPATATAERYLRSVVDIENTTLKGRWQRVNTAYRSALTRWPNNFVAQMGVGNSAYALGDLPSASRAFRRAMNAQPEAAVAHNNLAQVLMELGQLNEAEKYARHAVDLGGAHMESYNETLNAIQQAQQYVLRKTEKGLKSNGGIP